MILGEKTKKFVYLFDTALVKASAFTCSPDLYRQRDQVTGITKSQNFQAMVFDSFNVMIADTFEENAVHRGTPEFVDHMLSAQDHLAYFAFADDGASSDIVAGAASTEGFPHFVLLRYILGNHTSFIRKGVFYSDSPTQLSSEALVDAVSTLVCSDVADMSGAFFKTINSGGGLALGQNFAVLVNKKIEALSKGVPNQPVLTPPAAAGGWPTPGNHLH